MLAKINTNLEYRRIWWQKSSSEVRVKWRHLRKNRKNLKMNIFIGRMCVHAKSLQSCSTLCNRMDCSPPGSSVHGILQARTLEYVAMPHFRGSSQSRDRIRVSYVSCIAGRFFTIWATLSQLTLSIDNIGILIYKSISFRSFIQTDHFAWTWSTLT